MQRKFSLNLLFQTPKMGTCMSKWIWKCHELCDTSDDEQVIEFSVDETRNLQKKPTRNTKIGKDEDDGWDSDWGIL